MTQSAQAKAVLKGIATLAITTILFFLVYDSVINRVIPYVKLKLVERNIITPDLPDPVIPPKPIEESKKISVELLKSPYTPSPNPFSTENYSRLPKIVYKGEFKSADLNILGNVTSNTPVALLFNFGEETGFIDASRMAQNKIDIADTIKRGGLFDANQTIEKSVNLLGDELASSSEYFAATQSPTHFINFIANNDLTGTANMIVLPVDLSGKYGGATITSMLVQYECAENSECSIHFCEGSAYSCMLQKYDKAIADEWWRNYESINVSD